MKKMAALALAVVSLAGCTKTVDEMSYSERVALGKSIEQNCVSQGTVPGTAEYGQCLQVEANREVYGRIRAQQRERAALAADAAALRSTGEQMQANARNQQIVNALNRPTTTNCTRYGNNVRCNTY